MKNRVYTLCMQLPALNVDHFTRSTKIGFPLFTIEVLVVSKTMTRK